VNSQLHTTLELLADRNQPNYRGSIKNSISAVETVCRKLTGNNKATFGQALKRLKDAGIQLHPSLELAFGQLYGDMSDESGVRHARDLLSLHQLPRGQSRQGGSPTLAP
jgi:hypothetical protein